MRYILMAILLTCSAMSVIAPTYAKSAKQADLGTTPVSVEDQASFTLFKNKMNAAIVAKAGWNDPEYYYYDKAQHTATTAIYNTNNAAFQEQSTEARAIAKRMCGRMGGCPDVVFEYTSSRVRQ